VEASTSSWYPSQSASPLGHPEFAAGTAATAPDGGDHGVHHNVSTVESLFAAETGYANADESSLDSDVMAMWANAPTNFECVFPLFMSCYAMSFSVFRFH
jgi:hypothetical protein